MDLLHRRSTLEKVVEPVNPARFLRRKSTMDRLTEPVRNMDIPKSVTSHMPDVHAPGGVKSGLMAVGGLVGLTAGSAAISAKRRRDGSGQQGSG